MKKIQSILLLVTLFLIISVSNNLLAQNTANLKIIVKNIDEAKGNLIIKIWSDGVYMNNEKPYKTENIKIKSANILVVTIKNLKTGEYGISLFQDLNNNNLLDKNYIGKPKEPYGFSNNAKPNFGPPIYDKVKFNFSGSKTITISLL